MQNAVPLRVGGTSFVFHAPFVPAVRAIAPYCDDLSLLLCQTGKQGEWLPSAQDIREIGAILNGEGCSLHVHLPTDAHCGTPAQAQLLCQHIHYALDCVAPLMPQQYVLHLDVPKPGAQKTQPLWQNTPTKEQTALAALVVHSLLTHLEPAQLCVENLENYAPNFWDALINQHQLAHCLDAGHIWKDAGRPEHWLSAWLPNCPVLHVHGMTQQGAVVHDHQSLALMPPACIDALLFPLWACAYAGVLLLEVFNQHDFFTSQQALLASYERWQRRTLCP